MERVERPTTSTPGGESKAHTPAYDSFDTDKVLHLLAFILRGIQGYLDEFQSKVAPEAKRIATEIKQVCKTQGKEATGQVARNTVEVLDNLVQSCRTLC